MAYIPPNPNGATTGANSQPVVSATDDVNLKGLAASAAGGYVRQDSNGTIAKETGGNLATIATNTTGVSTAANQVTMNSNLSTIVTNTGSGATSANQTNGTQQTKITDGTNVGTVKAASTAAVTTDKAVVVAVSPNNTIAVTESGTWNVGLSAGTNAVGSITNTSFAATQATAASLNATVVGTGTFVVQAAQSGNYTVRNQDGSGNALTSTNGSLNVVQQASTGTLTQVNSSATSVTLLASNTSRKSATIYNNSTSLLYVAFASSASSTAFTVPLSASTYYEVVGGYTGIITGIWASVNGTAVVTEIT